MPRSVQGVGETVFSELVVYDQNDVPVTGLVDGDFSKFLFVNGAPSGQVVVVTELGNGAYEAAFIPNAVGTWYLLVRQATYNPRGWDEEFDVTLSGILTNDGIATALLDLPNAIDGYTVRELGKIVGAVLAGKVSGAPGTPVFRSLDDLAVRVQAVCDASGDRTSVTLTP